MHHDNIWQTVAVCEWVYWLACCVWTWVISKLWAASDILACIYCLYRINGYNLPSSPHIIILHSCLHLHGFTQQASTHTAHTHITLVCCDIAIVINRQVTEELPWLYLWSNSVSDEDITCGEHQWRESMSVPYTVFIQIDAHALIELMTDKCGWNWWYLYQKGIDLWWFWGAILSPSSCTEFRSCSRSVCYY